MKVRGFGIYKWPFVGNIGSFKITTVKQSSSFYPSITLLLRVAAFKVPRIGVVSLDSVSGRSKSIRLMTNNSLQTIFCEIFFVKFSLEKAVDPHVQSLYFRVFKEYPKKSQIWQSETSPNQGIPNQVPWLGLVSLFQIWDFCGYSLNTPKNPKMGICYFFLGWSQW